MADKTDKKTELHINPDDPEGGKKIIITGDIADLHNDPQRIHKLLDLLEMPEGTSVRVVTVAASIIVR
jgi:hypothetical protein